MTSLSAFSSARYLVFEQVVVNGEATLIKVFCSTIAEARRILARNWMRWQRSETARVYLTISNGYKPGNLPAAMVETQSRRYGRQTAAIAHFASGKAELGVIALYV